jgi:hypothetical protein
MGDKPAGAYKQQRESRRRAYVDTPCLREELPGVEQLVVRLTFADPKSATRHSPQTHTYSPAAKAFFVVACPSSMCLHGGFDLGPAIAEMLADGADEVTGTATCPGWRGPTRTDPDRCLIEMRYNLLVSYKAREDAG